MELKTAIEIIEYHQEWRLGKREDMIHKPKVLTQALDIVINEVKEIHSNAAVGLVFFTTEELKGLKTVSNYLREKDKTSFEHCAYSYLNNILKRN